MPVLAPLASLLQTTQIYVTVTSASMLAQQLLLRLPAFRTFIRLPAHWPLSGEALERLNKLRDSVSGGFNSAQMFEVGLQ